MADAAAGVLLGSGLAAWVLGAVAALLRNSPVMARRLAHALAALGSALNATAALMILLRGGALGFGPLPLVPVLPGLTFRLDPLAAWFILLVSGLALAASVYALGYLEHSPLDVSLLGGGWNLFLAAMVALLLAADGLAFLFAWEVMSVVSFLLVSADHTDPEVRRAGYFYAVMTHAGTACLFAAFLLLYARTGSLSFEVWRSAAGAWPGGLRTGVFILLLIGFGTKARQVPQHLWLPRAHPVAPSHVSAMMSGAMVKTALYGLLRFAGDLLGTGPAWWGLLVAVLGIASALTGVLFATQQSHVKRLLAFSTVENVGLMTLSLGAALIARSAGQSALAGVALAAVLLHAMGHAAFKGLLFLGAGSIQHGTHTLNLERLGGLIRPMPRTAALVLTGAAAAAGLPPLAGFVGEWLGLQTFFGLAYAAPNALTRTLALGAVAAIALAAALGAAAALKLFGIGFLAQPRSAYAAEAQESGGAMLAGMGLLAAAVFGLGLFPGPVLALARPALLAALPGAVIPAAFTWVLGGAPLAGGRAGGGIAPTVILLLLGLLALLAYGLLRTAARGRLPWRRGMTWTCGITPDVTMQYSAAGFTKPILLMFRGLLRPVRTLAVDPSPHPLFPGRVHYQSEVRAVFELYLYRPVTRSVLAAADRLRRLQTGSLHTYLAYLLITVVILIVLARG